MKKSHTTEILFYSLLLKVKALMVPLISPRIYLLDRSFQKKFMPIKISKYGT